MDASRGGSRPSLSSVAISNSYLSSDEGSNTPSSKSPGVNETWSPVFQTPPKDLEQNNVVDDTGSSPTSSLINIFTPPKESEIVRIETCASAAVRSEYANVITLNKPEDLNPRSHSFSGQRKNSGRKVSLNRTESAVCESMKKPAVVKYEDEEEEEEDHKIDFGTKIQLIQNQLSEKLCQQTDPTSK